MRIFILALLLPLGALAQTAPQSPQSSPATRVLSPIEQQIQSLHQTLQQAAPPAPAANAVSAQGLLAPEESFVQVMMRNTHLLLQLAQRLQAHGNAAAAQRDVQLAASMTKDLQAYLAAAKPK